MTYTPVTQLNIEEFYSTSRLVLERSLKQVSIMKEFSNEKNRYRKMLHQFYALRISVKQDRPQAMDSADIKKPFIILRGDIQ